MTRPPTRLSTLPFWQQFAVERDIRTYIMRRVGADGILRSELTTSLCEWAENCGVHVCDALEVLRNLEASQQLVSD